jgi:hypothetical protein
MLTILAVGSDVPTPVAYGYSNRCVGAKDAVR